uniref:SWIM-type domain-containing protein n=1 Tax=Peronospora matthiolae TaxID=2874970 RepID=A0AAV1UVS6_9STRA
MTIIENASAVASPDPHSEGIVVSGPRDATEGPPLVKGMRFKDSKTAFYAVQDYALFHNKQVKVDRRGGKHRKMVCASSEPCPFFVRLYLHNSKTDKTWYVSSAELAHAPECTSTAKPTQRQLVESLSFQQALASTPDGTAAQLLQRLQGKANLRTVYRAKQMMKRELQVQVGNSFRKIPSLLRNFSALNPGSFARHEVSDRQSKVPGAFARAFVSCHVFTDSTTFNQQIYGLEVRPCHNSKANYQGVQIFLLGKDGNMCNVTIAAACCDAPSSENYRWFFRCVEESGVNLRYCPVLCKIDAELMAVETELALTLRYCTKYVIEHELVQLETFSRHHHALVWGLQGSETEAEYDSRLEWIGTACGPRVESYLRQFPMERWVVAGNIGKVAMYGWRSRTFVETSEREQQVDAGAGHGLGIGGLDLGGSCGVENTEVRTAPAALSLNASARPANATAESAGPSAKGLDRYRDMLPFTFFETIMASFMQDAFERSMLATSWKRQNRKVTQGAQDLYDAQCKRIGEYKVGRASETVAFVTKVNNDAGVRRCVDLHASTCTCGFIDQYALPCRHLIAVLLFCEQMDSVIDRFAPGYLVENYAMAFREKVVELPLESALGKDFARVSSARTATVQRTRTSSASRDNKDLDATLCSGANRTAPASDVAAIAVRSATEGFHAEPGAAQARVRLCKKCRGPGHNSRSCSVTTVTSEQTPGCNGNIVGNHGL